MDDRTALVTELDRFVRRLVADCPVDDVWGELVGAAARILGLHGAGASVVRDDRVGLASATAGVHALEWVQERHQRGPCIEAFRSGATILVADIRAESRRWPDLAAAAARAGVRAVAAVPLEVDGSRIGALALYSDRPRTWTEDDVRTASLMATLTAGCVAHASQLDQERRTAEQLQHALDSRVVIEQAKGLIAGERGVSVDEAFQVLRAHARSRRAPLREVAHAVVDLGMRP